jgi:DNA repair exonuclease SbcCD ATPase subunit
MGHRNDRNLRRAEGGNRKRGKQSLEEDNKKLKRYNQTLEENNKKLNRQLDEYNNTNKELKRKYDDELRRAQSERVEYQKQIAYLEHRHEELTASHIRSVSSIGTGLEPITDETFEREFRKLHDDVCFGP